MRTPAQARHSQPGPLPQVLCIGVLPLAICYIAEAQAKRAFVARRQQQRLSKLHWSMHLVVLLFALALADVLVTLVHRLGLAPLVPDAR
jgi:hypothetical protein